MTVQRTEKRTEKIKQVISNRQPSLKLVLENIHDPHNVSAIFRTCDSAGIPNVSLIYNLEQFPKIGKKSSASAFKWIEKEKFKTVNECYKKLHSCGFKIFASSISKDSKNLFDLNFTGKTAIVFGNEHRGLSNEAKDLADGKFFIPMFGMVQSLNVSVSAAISIYEALRQRLQKGMYNKTEYSETEMKKLIDVWTKK
ncbi:MAG: RNA methyltransferase [Ignavibacteria bacterium]|nr:RNA methyltransferase [Ignavibacteria bacterium]MBT8383292.1 RNA methyltransferase [Ignavibacteria bacterium]NNL21673.1 RNA methyltransferase [Ignavibacteriaceae bacterium]